MPEGELQPPLPTSGQIVGAVVKGLGIDDPALRSKTARRYFSGDPNKIIKESNKQSVLRSTARAFATLGLVPPWPEDSEGEPLLRAIESALQIHAANWDALRSFLKPRMAQVFTSHLPMAWATYARLATIDLALRTAAYLHLAGLPTNALTLLGLVKSDTKGRFLNEKRTSAGVSLESLASEVEVSDNTVDAWMYKAARPRDYYIPKIAKALASGEDISAVAAMTSEIRRFYWLCDVTGLLAQHVGTDAIGNMLGRLQQYATAAYSALESKLVPDDKMPLNDLFLYGVHSRLAEPLLSVLAAAELDHEWNEDLRYAGVDWKERVLTVILQIHESEVDTLNTEMDGQLLKDWDVSSPEAYAHYKLSYELQLRGRTFEALDEVAKAAALDPLDPANHFTLGSMWGGIGAHTGDTALIERGFTECWLAVRLDPKWILPWTEVGWILINTGRNREAIDHLKAVPKECGPLDARYYAALGTAYRNLGRSPESLDAYERSLEIEPQDPNIALAAMLAANDAGNTLKARHYEKLARHLGA